MSTSSISYSQQSYPPSPPPNNNREHSQAMSYQHPQTPESPSHPSSASAGKSPTIDFTRSTADTMFPTPANSTNGGAFSSGTEMSQDPSIDIQGSPNKRKRHVDDMGDREQKKFHCEDRRLGIEDLHLDVGKKYLLCRTPHSQVQPNPARDLFELYSLDPIANSVARILPNGEKNKLRKTYKGKIKDLGINGKFDVVVREDDAPDALLTMLRQPEEEWMAQNRLGKEIEKGIPSQIRASLPAAMTMAKGAIPRSSWDSSVLGELDLPERKISTIPTPNKPVAAATVPKGPGLNPAPRNPKLDLTRPKRNVKKRGYEDSSFEGYGEGYVDDDIVDAGYSTAEGDERGMSQKRRKKSATSNAYPGPMRHNSYGPGMVGA